MYVISRLVLVALCAVALPAQAVHWNLLYKFCPEELFRIPEIFEEIPIPVGCEVIDCCPGCPGPGPLDWLISVDEKLFTGATLRIEGLPLDQLRALSLTGNIEFDKEGFFKLGTGEISINGIPAEVDGRVPVGFIVPDVNREAFDSDAEVSDNAEDEPDGSIEIVQMREQYVVNRFGSRYAIRICPNPDTDKLKVLNNTSNDSTISMIDFRGTGGCVNDQLVRTTNTANVGRALTNGSCNSEVVVFSDDNAMAFDTPVTTWTNALGDIHEVDLEPIITVPVSVWATTNALATQAQADVANANLLYNQNNVGVQFDPTISNLTGNAAAIATLGTWCPTVATVGALQGSAWYTANTLNAYYVNSAFTGVNCGADLNVNYLGTTANLGSLPHEFGHAYGMRPVTGNWGHTNGIAGFGNQNIMWGGGPGTRNHFSVGQSFRINSHTPSMLNVNGDRTGPTRNCLPNASSNTCPVLSLDSLPH